MKRIFTLALILLGLLSAHVLFAAEILAELRTKAGEGSAEAQSRLGFMYGMGADQSDAHAQFNLGRMYDKGEGVPQDSVEAVNWYRRAAEQGDAKPNITLALATTIGKT